MLRRFWKNDSGKGFEIRKNKIFLRKKTFFL